MSKPFMLTYDLNSPCHRYTEIKEIIESELSSGEWCHFWDSTYLLRSNLSASEMMDKLKAKADSGDKFFITEIVKNEYSGWLTEDQWKYIKEHIVY